MELNIIDMYSDILNTYGDIGNLKCIQKRCLWRDIKPNITSFIKDKPVSIDYENTDMILIGGGSDRNQSIVSNHLLNERNNLQEYIDNGGVVLAICGSYQMFGDLYLDVNKNKIPCLEIFNIETTSYENRFIGNILIENMINLEPKTIVGFENHGGRTYHNYNPLGKVKIGYGNNSEDGKEGMIYKNFIGSYIHGPFLPKNPHVADYMILNALQKKYNITSLKQLDNTIEQNAHNAIVTKLINKSK